MQDCVGPAAVDPNAFVSDHPIAERTQCTVYIQSSLQLALTLSV